MALSLGRYELMRQLARGGMADVYLARRRAAAGIEKRLVIKRIRPELAADPRFVRLFVKEARLSVDLVHANIVPVFDFGRVGDALFLAMEHVDGRDLATVLKRAGRLDPVLVAHIGVEACRGLDYAHRRRDPAGRPLGIVHRDVTPRNVLLSRAGEVKLVDFGVASLAGEDHGRVRGTPAYMSPEQARGELVDGRSDVFSLALVLAEAVTGHRVHGGPDALEQARAGVAAPFGDDVPEALRQVLERATRLEPGERFADARAMQQALEQIVVTARAADRGRAGPEHEIGPLLGRLFPDEVEPAAPLEGAAAVEGGKAVTFLDDGEGAVSRVLDDDAGDVTLRSIAETVGEGSVDVPAAPVAPPAPPPPPRARWPWAVAAAVVVGGGAAGAAFLARAPRPPSPPAGAPVPVPAAAVPAPAPAAAMPAPAPAPALAPADAGAGEPHASAPPRPAVPRRSYSVDINSKPWAKVYVDDRYVDDTPFRTELSAGSHRLRFVSLDGASKTVTIEVPRVRRVVEELAK